MDQKIKDNKIKIFGIGLSRTGTRSLTKALNILGYKAVHWNYTKTIIKYLDKKRLFIDFNKLKKYDAFTDIPIAGIYKELDMYHPNSKFILTTRDIGGWLNSCKNHFKHSPPKERNKELCLDLYGTVHFKKKKFKEAYTRHLKEVLTYFKGRERDLLIIDICGGEGWEKLCQFLNKPLHNQAFPRLGVRNNKRIGRNSKINKNIGLIGIYMKKHSPKLHLKLKKLIKAKNET